MIPRSTQFTITLFIEASPNGTVYLYASDGITDSMLLVGDACRSLLSELNQIIEVPVLQS